MENESYQIPKEWVNIGDINPERHGGIFVKWDRDMWHIIRTTHFAELPNGLSENEHMFEHIWFEPMDIWEKGNPENGFTDWAINQLETFSSLGFEVIESQEELPDNETYADYMRFVIGENGEELITTLAFAFSGYYGSDHRPDFEEDYWGYLENHGIEKEEFKG